MGIRRLEKPLLCLRKKPGGPGKEEAKDRELYQIVSLLKNLAVMSGESPVGADAVISETALMANLTKPALLKMQALMRQSEKERARRVFVNETGTTMAGRVADILLFWDEVSPDGLLDMLAALSQSLGQERITRERIRDEKFGQLVYAPIFANVLLLFLNFLILTFFKTQQDSINMFFN